jgi:predicted Rossmann-fold nucleotide-binding protein
MEKVYKKRYETRKKEYSKYREIVTVFSSVSNEAPTKFKQACIDLGEMLSENDYKISYGGSRGGCNRWLVDGAEKTGKGDIRAVAYKSWAVNKRMEKPPKGMRTEVVHTNGPNLMQRIAELKKDALACVVLPGGPATLEEMWNAIGGVAEFAPIPVIIVNIDGFYNEQKEQMEKMSDYFYWPKYNKYVLFVDSIKEVIETLNTFRYLKIIQRGETPYKSNAERKKRSNSLKKSKELSKTRKLKKRT